MSAIIGKGAIALPQTLPTAIAPEEAIALPQTLPTALVLLLST